MSIFDLFKSKSAKSTDQTHTLVVIDGDSLRSIPDVSLLKKFTQPVLWVFTRQTEIRKWSDFQNRSELVRQTLPVYETSLTLFATYALVHELVSNPRYRHVVFLAAHNKFAGLIEFLKENGYSAESFNNNASAHRDNREDKRTVAGEDAGPVRGREDRRGNRPERTERPERSERGERPDRNSRSSSERPDRNSRNSNDRNERPDRNQDRSGNDRNQDRSGSDRNQDRSGNDRNQDRSGNDRNQDRSGNDRNQDRSGNDRNQDRSGNDRNQDRSSIDRNQDRSSNDRNQDRSSIDRSSIDRSGNDRNQDRSSDRNTDRSSDRNTDRSSDLSTDRSSDLSTDRPDLSTNRSSRATTERAERPPRHVAENLEHADRTPNPRISEERNRSADTTLNQNAEKPSPPTREKAKPVGPDPKDFEKMTSFFNDNYKPDEVYQKSFLGMLINQATGKTTQQVLNTKSARPLIKALYDCNCIENTDEQHFKVLKPVQESDLNLTPVSAPKRKSKRSSGSHSSNSPESHQDSSSQEEHSHEAQNA